MGENGGNGAAVLVEWSYAQKGERTMRELEERIRRDGIVEDGDVLKVDSFLNHQKIGRASCRERVFCWV